MATMNVLQGNFRGTVGAETGVRAKGKSIVKKRIWSKTPNNEAQEGSVRSFECLNRVSSAMAKKYWEWLGISQGNMHKHNAIAKEFKALVQNHVFSPMRFSDKIQYGDAITVNAFQVDTTSGRVAVNLTAALPWLGTGRQSALIMVFDGKGYVHLCEKLTSQVFSTEFRANLFLNFPYYLVAFSSTREGKKIKLQNLAIKMTLSENVFYAESYPKIRWWTVEPNYLYGEGAGIGTQENILVVESTIG